MIPGWIRTRALPWGSTNALSNAAPAPASTISGFTILEKVTVGTDPTATQPDCGIKADGAAHDWTFVKCRFIPNGTNGAISFYCQLGFRGNVPGQACFDDAKLPPIFKATSFGTAHVSAVK